MKLKFTRLIPSIALVCLLFASCKKDDAVNNAQSPAVSPQQSARVTSMVGAMEDATDLESSDMFTAESVETITGKGADGDCPVRTATYKSTHYPRTVTYDYGTGCTDEFGRTISGKRIVNVKANFRTAPAGTIYAVTTYSNYYVNGVNISGNVTNKVVTAGTPGGFVGQSIYKRTVSDGAGNTSTFLGKTVRTQVIGDVNSVKEDAGFSLNIIAYGVELTPGEATVVWQAKSDTLSPPIQLGSCIYRTQGLVKITLASLNAITHETLNYGNGDCDNNAILKVNGVPQPIKLPFQFFTNHL
jgi:hypothetical protein